MFTSLLAYLALDDIPARGLVGIVFGQSPDAMQMVGQQNERVDGERIFFLNITQRIFQCLVVQRLSQELLTVMCIYCEEIGCTGCGGSPESSHGADIRPSCAWRTLHVLGWYPFNP